MKGKKGDRTGRERDGETRRELKMETEKKKERHGHDRVVEDERQHCGAKTRCRVVNESETIRMGEMRGVEEVIGRWGNIGESNAGSEAK